MRPDVKVVIECQTRMECKRSMSVVRCYHLGDRGPAYASMSLRLRYSDAAQDSRANRGGDWAGASSDGARAGVRGQWKDKETGPRGPVSFGGSGKLLVAFMIGGYRTYVLWAPMERRCTRGPLATTSTCVRTGSSCRRLSFFRARLRENSQCCRPSCGHPTNVDRQVHFSYRSSM
jgi:hypothetical protein